MAKEHLKGRRADYLHPIRLYIFTSAFFFLIMFGFYSGHKKERETYLQKVELINKLIEKENSDLTAAKTSKDSTAINKAIINYKNKLDILKIDTNYNNMSVVRGVVFKGNIKNSTGIMGKFKKAIETLNSSDEEKDKFLESFLHAIPKALFIVLPFYALLLLIIYARNKQFNYVNHLLFSIYLFSFTLILILCATWLNSLLEKIKIDITGAIILFSMCCAMLYTYKSLRKFYEQGRLKTILKFCILSFSCLLLAIVVMALAFSISALTV